MKRSPADRLVERVALDAAQARAGVIHHLRAVGVGDHGLARCAHGHRLPPAGVARVLVRLDDAGGDEQVGLVGCAVHRERDAASGRAQVH